MGEVGMAWRVVYRLAGTKKYPRACRQKNDGGKERERRKVRRGKNRTEREETREREREKKKERTKERRKRGGGRVLLQGRI